MFDELLRAYADEWYCALKKCSAANLDTVCGATGALVNAGQWLAAISCNDDDDYEKVSEFITAVEDIRDSIYYLSPFSDDDITTGRLDESIQLIKIAEKIHERT